MPRHKHADVIIAWANGEEIEFKNTCEEWELVTWVPLFAPSHQFRIKPKIVKREGWGLMSQSRQGEPVTCTIYDDIFEAGAVRQRLKREGTFPDYRIVRIEWEEEV